MLSANRSFYGTFKVTPEETLGHVIYELGNGQWDIPQLRTLLEGILSKEEAFADFEVVHDFKEIGRKVMLLNCRRIYRESMGTETILLAIEDITERKRLEDVLRESEERYKGAFETASDAIALLEKDEGRIIQANPAFRELTGYSREDNIGKTLQNIGVLPDMDDFQKMLQALNEGGIIHYKDVLVRTKAGQDIDTDIYLVDKTQLVQCNIRDVTSRRLVEEERAKLLLWQKGVNLLQQSLLAAAKLEEKLTAMTDSIVSLFDVDFCRIWLIYPGDLCEQGCIHAGVHEGPHICRYRDRCLHLLASSGRYTHTDGKVHRRVPFGCYKIGLVASDEDHRFLTNDVQNDPRIHDHEWARELGLVSFAGYQLRVPGGKTLGVLALFAQHPILSSEDAILDGLSSSVAMIIQRDLAEVSLRDTLERLHKAMGATIQVLVSTVETRDPYTAGHQIRSADLARAIATEMGLSQDAIDAIAIAGSIHDIGKLSVPAEILSKPAKLTDIEYSLIKVHPQTGYDMLKGVGLPFPIAEMVYQHHERIDGSGYPINLKGEEILIGARILAVADVMEAMASHRPYRPALGIEAAIEEIEKNKGILYDPQVSEVCLKLFREKRFRFVPTES